LGAVFLGAAFLGAAFLAAAFLGAAAFFAAATPTSGARASFAIPVKATWQAIKDRAAASTAKIAGRKIMRVFAAMFCNVLGARLAGGEKLAWSESLEQRLELNS